MINFNALEKGGSPIRKKEILAWAEGVIEEKLDSENTFRLLGQLIRMKTALETMEARVRRAAQKELTGPDSYYGMELSTRPGNKKYDYSTDPAWNRIQQMLKEHEARLRAIKRPTELVDPTTGELYTAQIVPVIQASDSLVVILK